MHRPRVRSFSLALGLAALAVATVGRADVPSPPQRPTWDQEPAPLPQPPPEKDLERAALAALAAIAVVLAARSSRAGGVRARAETRS